MVAWLGLGSLKRRERLWPCSPSTLRSRLKQILLRLGLPIAKGSRVKPLTLASFRPGGAAFFSGQTESFEQAQRRGRWVSLQATQVYAQEVIASAFLMGIPRAFPEQVLLATVQFPTILQKSFSHANAALLERVWQFLFTQRLSEVETRGQTG